MIKPSKNFETYFSRVLLGAVTLSIILLVLPFTVLKGWTLKTNKGNYTVGEKIQLTSEYTKKYDLKGQSSRLLVCKTATGTASYPIFYSFAGANVGHQKVVSTVTIPEVEQKLPVECKIRVDILYTVAGIKPVSHTAISNSFVINPGGKQ